MDNNYLKVMVAGHICLDITPVFNPNIKGGFSDILSPGKLINVGRAVLSTGGAVANTGQALIKLGLEVLLNGKVGDDMIGAVIKQLLGSQQSCSLKTVSGQSSSYTIVLALPEIDRVFLHNPGTNDTFTAYDVDYEALKGCSLFHFGYPTLMKQFYENQGDELLKMFRLIHDKGIITSMDVTPPDPQSVSGKVDWHSILKKVLPYVDIFLPSIEEIAYMLDRDLFEKRKLEAGGEDPVFSYTAGDCTRLSEIILEMGTAIVAIKNGIRGYYLRTAASERLDSLMRVIECGAENWTRRELWASSYQAKEFKSATGAGDATIAGFLAAFLRGLSPVECLKVANMVGWQNIRQVDAVSGIEDWHSTLNMIQCNHRLMNPLEIKEPRWRFHPSEQVFYGPMDCIMEKE